MIELVAQPIHWAVPLMVQTIERPTASSRDKILEAAMELFYFHGYEATSISEIVKRAGVLSGSLYHFFKSKEDVLLAVLERYKEMLWAEIIEPVFGQTDDPLERVFGILENYRNGLEFTHCTGGCPIGNLALEVSDSHPQARGLIAENFAAWKGWVQKCFEDAKDRLAPGADPEQLATFVLTVMEGGVMQSRAMGSIKPFEASVAMLKDYIRRLAKDRPKKV